MEFLNKQYLVTGVTSGIGKSIAENLLIKGARVFGIGRDYSKVKMNNVFVENEKFTFCEIDLLDVNKIERVLAEYCSNNNKFDGFAHCAGKEETIPLRIYNNEKIKSIFEINVFAGIELTRVMSKKKITNDGASLVMLASVMGELGQPGKIGYCASKSAILGAVRAASLELAKRKIRINAVSPGIVNTPMTQKLFETLSNENIDNIKEMHPLGFGEVEDVFPIVLFLLSNQSKWVTGQNFKIDGGYSIH